jgi:hypothetical protein
MASTFLAIFGLVTSLIRSSTSVTSVYSDGAEEKDLADDGQGELMGRAWQRFEATEAWQQPCFLSFSDLQIATVA